MKFRRRIKVFPGFSLNLSGSGISGTFGIPGASINVGSKGAFLNTGIPGTGLYDRQRIGGARTQRRRDHPLPVEKTFDWDTPEHIQSAAFDDLSSSNMAEMLRLLREVYQDRVDLSAEINRLERRIRGARRLRVMACLFLVGFVVPWFRTRIYALREDLEETHKQWESERINLNLEFDELMSALYDDFRSTFEDLMGVEHCWDVTAISTISPHSHRIPVQMGMHEFRIIKCNYPAFHFENANGADLYVYPGFIALISRSKEFAIVSLSDIKLEFTRERFADNRPVPSDAKVVEMTWLHARKDGSPDRRYRNNYQLPVVEFGCIRITSSTGLNEAYSFSNSDKAWAFAQAFHKFAASVKSISCIKENADQAMAPENKESAP